MGRYLVVFSDNHGDEFDVHGFKTMTDQGVTNFEEIATNITWEFSFYANDECLTYSNGEDFLTRIEFKEISKDEFESLNKLFGGEFGTFITEEYLQSILDGDIESLDEENDEDEEF